jgi:hypothetical protein
LPRRKLKVGAKAAVASSTRTVPTHVQALEKIGTGAEVGPTMRKISPAEPSKSPTSTMYRLPAGSSPKPTIRSMVP